MTDGALPGERAGEVVNPGLKSLRQWGKVLLLALTTNTKKA